jgi:hypothetical protein
MLAMKFNETGDTVSAIAPTATIRVASPKLSAILMEQLNLQPRIGLSSFVDFDNTCAEGHGT